MKCKGKASKGNIQRGIYKALPGFESLMQGPLRQLGLSDDHTGSAVFSVEGFRWGGYGLQLRWREIKVVFLLTKK